MSVTAFNRRRRLLAAASQQADVKVIEIASGHEYAQNVEQTGREQPGDAQQVEKGGRKHGRTSRKTQNASGDRGNE